MVMLMMMLMMMFMTTAFALMLVMMFVSHILVFYCFWVQRYEIFSATWLQI